MSGNDMFAEVAIPLPLIGTFTYQLTDACMAMAKVGQRVLVPFGPRRLTGYLVKLKASANGRECRNIIEILDERPLFPETMLPFLRWVANYYLHGLGEVIETALPQGLTLRDHTVWTLSDEGRRALADDRTEKPMHAVLQHLTESERSLATLKRQFGRPKNLLERIQRRGWIVAHRKLGAPLGIKTEWVATFQRMPDPGVRLSAVRRKILDYLRASGPASGTELRKITTSASKILRSMAADGWIHLSTQRVRHDPLGEPIQPQSLPELTGEQRAAVDEIGAHLGKGYAPFALAGVTGSGKTEVYMRLAEKALAAGRQVLVLVPEIALITAVERRFRSRFGDQVAVLHSALTKAQRYDQWLRILEGSSPIAIGARSALFAPFARLGLIVVDEEHDGSYKQENGVPYNARDMAAVRARQNDATLVLGSATLSMQTYYHVCSQRYREIRLQHRVRRQPLPRVDVVDLKDDSRFGSGPWYLSARLHEAIGQTLARKEQVLLFLNRRGYASFPVCEHCGQGVQCPHCSVTLTYHQRANAHRCHYCGYSQAASQSCGHCGAGPILNRGLGTEKLAEMVAKTFPDARVARMDRDTTTRRQALVAMLTKLKNRTIDVLIGTQMVAKGHDFPGITLVGIVCADSTLNLPDFRAEERTFQLLAQVAGRAGRGHRPGQVILQTFNPDHFAIQTARKQDFRAFYERAIVDRKTLHYPPFYRMVQLRIDGRNPDKTRRFAFALGRQAQLQSKTAGAVGPVEVLGPIEAPIAKVADRYRWLLLLRAPRAGRLHQFTRRFLADAGPARGSIRIRIDVDPYFLM